jgi:hypothetical protein
MAVSAPSVPRESALSRLLTPGTRATTTIDPALRRHQGRELLVVLLLFPLGSAFAAVVDLVNRLEFGRPLVGRSVILATNPWVAGLLESAARVIGLAPAVLVAFLLGSSGERLASIGLDRKRLRTDLALVLPIFVIVQWLPQGIGGHLVDWLHFSHFFLIDPLVRFPVQYTVANTFAGVAAGILEEVVVLGYLVRRLEQRGMNPTAIVVIAVLVRVSYHLYYGWGAVPIALWALATVLMYRRIRRLLPFILCHIAWDVAIPFRHFYPGFYREAWWVVLVAGAATFLGWARWSPAYDPSDAPT